MDGWLGVVIMIVLGVGFAGVMIGFPISSAPEIPPLKSSRPTNAACPRSAMPASGSP
jgi:hypothetical protein